MLTRAQRLIRAPEGVVDAPGTGSRWHRHDEVIELIQFLVKGCSDAHKCQSTN